MRIAKVIAKKHRTISCPICNKTVVKAFRPFCSKRCADVDLSRWLTGQYAIPITEEDGGIPTPFEDDNVEK